jgi:hypothetical protein
MQHKNEHNLVSEIGLSPDEEKLLSEAVRGLKSVPHGSMVLAMHGHWGEVTKTVRIRTCRSSTIRFDTSRVSLPL